MDNAFLRGLRWALAVAGGLVVRALGGFDSMLAALAALIVIDYVTGLLKAVHNRALSSEVGLRGIARKVLILAVVAVANIIQGVTGDMLPLREITIAFFVANEGISILENAVEAGVSVPEKLRRALRQMRDGEDG